MVEKTWGFGLEDEYGGREACLGEEEHLETEEHLHPMWHHWGWWWTGKWGIKHLSANEEEDLSASGYQV